MPQLPRKLQSHSPVGLAQANPAHWPVSPDWAPLTDEFFASQAGLKLLANLAAELDAGETIWPAQPLRALRLTSKAATKVLILGQDPYPTAGHADGLAFSAGKGRPKSLARVTQVLEKDRPGWVAPAHSRLDAWATQGVLLINTALTVRQGQAGSHLDVGWHSLTGKILTTLADPSLNVTFLLWGDKAQRFADAAFGELAPGARPPAARVLRTRHPSYDFKQQFMSQGSHFEVTSHLIDWWRWRQDFD